MSSQKKKAKVYLTKDCHEELQGFGYYTFGEIVKSQPATRLNRSGNKQNYIKHTVKPIPIHLEVCDIDKYLDEENCIIKDNHIKYKRKMKEELKEYKELKDLGYIVSWNVDNGLLIVKAEKDGKDHTRVGTDICTCVKSLYYDIVKSFKA